MKQEMKIKRGTYNEILLSSLNAATKKVVMNLFNDAKKSDKIDEHGNWEFGAEFDKKGRGYAINWDLYAVGKDYFSKKTLIVIQIRKWEKQRKNGFANIQKSYFLIGRNEDNTTFAHPVESRVIHHAIKSEEDVVRAVQSWIFGCDYAKVIRQGDLALIPVRKPTGNEVNETDLILQDSHRLVSEKIFRNGVLYAFNPSLYHLPGTHPNLENKTGWFKVVVGKRGNFYDFATPTID